MIEIDNLKFNEDGLIPAIVVDGRGGNVLMLAYMSKESLQISIDEGKTCFWSRSRKALWRKGETSGNVQNIINIKADCDMDTLLVTVYNEGPACHTGAETCFNEDVYNKADSEHYLRAFSLGVLHEIVMDRKENPKPGSYTNYLFDKGIDKILKKFGEEAVEVIIAGKSGDKENTVYELGDLVYHAAVLMAEMNITPDEIKTELASRYTKRAD
ncbi:MAG: bifunctional phosphoribosyl-AMP cyclohydrolase/phosphoribosyl-ATP diphosphatase HisIE [Oscillospiraceae bacterium]|nr:bifunctional phosphoribosyl-AMP cyclohydrolase/phosphoribosyl-ATP diphosphatase HisIE [Oscillospiraceae bacterium]